MKNSLRTAFIHGAIALGLLISPYLSHAQQSSDTSYQAMSEKFFNLLQQGKGSDAVDYLTSTNPAMKKIPDQIDSLKAQFGSLGTLMGSYISNEKLVETKVAGMFVYQHYFVAYERQPISVRIKYYKPGATWLCYGVQFDADLVDHIQKEADSRIPIDVK
jgi:hypothetical protein